MSQEVIRLLFLDLLLEHLFNSVSALLRFYTYSLLLGLFSLLLVVEANKYLVQMMVLAAAEGTQVIKT